jgi:DNA-binding NarL/FixJ family response regulator
MSGGTLFTHASGPRVVIVDADRRVQQSLGDVLRVTGEVIVVGAAGDVRSALELIDRERPDVVVVDPRLPDVSAGDAFIASVRLAWPRTRIVLTGWSDAAEQPRLTASAASYASKSALPEDFVAAVLDACCLPQTA